MYQKQDKLISIRMPADLVDKLDSVAFRHSFYKRSDVLRALVSQVFNDLTDLQVSEIMRNLSIAKSCRKVLRLHDPDS